MGELKLIIRGGTVVAPHGSYRRDITCEDGIIRSADSRAEPSPGDEVIDADGLLVFPGFIDPHVHSRDPGQQYKEDFAHLTRAAAAGGVTTVFEMPNAVPPITNAGILGDRAAYLQRQAHVDFGLWGVSLGAANMADIPDLLNEGAVAIKLFWGYALDATTKLLVYNFSESSGDLMPPPSNRDVCELFRIVGEHGGVLAAHCEDRALIQVIESRLKKPQEKYQDVLEARPAAAESAAVALGSEYSRAFDCHFHVMHVSAAATVKLIRSAQDEGIRITAETCPHYLELTSADIESMETPSKVYPPVRHDEDRAALWRGIFDGTLASLGSDHAPHAVEEKLLPLSDQPAGYIGVETMSRIIIDAALREKLPMEQVAWLLSEATARIYGIYPRKGAIFPGSDADLTLVDPQAEWTIKHDDLHSKNRYGPWEGKSGFGAPTMSIVRGSVVMKDLEPVMEPIGRLVKANHRPLAHKMPFRFPRR